VKAPPDWLMLNLIVPAGADDPKRAAILGDSERDANAARVGAGGGVGGSGAA